MISLLEKANLSGSGCLVTISVGARGAAAMGRCMGSSTVGVDVGTMIACCGRGELVVWQGEKLGEGCRWVGGG